ncbi:hypothetical protein TVAG_052680 [Trichomonas vaginalis G3]|uniref:N-acetylgalactosaminide beta-1,3-galactosyltransferase n=1 Tax=Trichomonas vaginalis (strain ATCC PRA-98 / G3) TaxID=412133 RepID=A2FZH2_TRIV3|nr:glycosyltransferase family 31 protein family [Trichomonas vaginalis G3]EAX89690.1 hypothetical protein TVAG_052680 [Trichomonas vaginalis G3]KAI5495810.1 glycosyltransferase family 31 protein family [Trichomonas vaginalis G3]|eukprot:XP_001302620.1 hypothetical protein [Trichomonas vaginalis G3]
MTQTWMQNIPEIDVYMQSLDNETYGYLQKNIGNSNLHLNIIPISQPCLIGTTNDNGWNHAQALHTVSYKYAYEKNPNKKIYVFLDDDTYFFPQSLISQINSEVLNGPYAFGCVYGSYIEIEKFYNPKRTSNHVFINGGGGIVVTKELLKLISEKNSLLTTAFVSHKFPSDMKLATFIDSIIGPIENYLLAWPGQSNAESPYTLIAELGILKTFPVGFPRISFHHIIDEDVQRLWRSSSSIFANKTVYWDNFSTQVIKVPFDDEIVNFAFGYAFYNDKLQNESCFSIENPVPDNIEAPKYYRQRYNCNVTVYYHCNGKSNEIILEKFSNDAYHFSIQCPSPVPYINKRHIDVKYFDYDPN